MIRNTRMSPIRCSQPSARASTTSVAEYKPKVTAPPADPDREARQIARLRKLSAEADLDPEFSEKFLRFIIDEVIRHHERAAAG